MSFISKEIKRFGYIEVNNNQILAAQYHFECDSQTDLPTQTQFQNDKNVFLFIGSTAHTIADNKKWEMKSDGTWVDMTNAPSTYDASDIIYDNTESGMTATNVQDAIDEIHDLDETQERELVELYAADAKNQVLFQELINGGAKNFCPKNSETSTAAGAFTDDFAVNIPAGTYVVSMICNAQQEFSLIFYRALPHSGNTIRNLVFDVVPSGTRQIKTVTLSEDAKYCAFYFNASGESLTEIMICTAAEWEVSQLYKPYAPTNAELQETKQDKLSAADRDLIRSLVYGNGFDLSPTSENQVDLNNLMTPGKYRIQSAAETDYVTNKPERRAAGIVVEVASSTGYIRQKWLPSLSANEVDYFYCRHYRSSGSGAANGWSAWYKYEGTVVT